MSVDWGAVQWWEDENDYKVGYDLGVTGKTLPRWASDACRDGYEEGGYERQARNEDARRSRAARARDFQPVEG